MRVHEQGYWEWIGFALYNIYREMPSISHLEVFARKSPAVSHKEKWPLGTLAFFHVWKSPSLLRIQFWHPGVSRKFQIHSPSKQPSVLTVNLSFILKYQNFNGRRSGGGGHFFIKDSTKDSKRQNQLCMIFYEFCAPDRCASILIYSFPLARWTSKWYTGCKDMLLSLFLELRVDSWAAFSSSLWQKDYFFSPVQLLVKSVKNRIFSRSLARTVQILEF